MNEGNGPYYAVRRGRAPGIYRSWEAAKKQVEGFSSPEHRRFSTSEQAEAVMRGEEIPGPPVQIPPREAAVRLWYYCKTDVHQSVIRERRDDPQTIVASLSGAELQLMES